MSGRPLSCRRHPNWLGSNAGSSTGSSHWPIIDSRTFAREGNSEIGRRSVCTDRRRGSFGAGITSADLVDHSVAVVVYFNHLTGKLNRKATDHYTALRWLVHWPLMGGLLHLVQRAHPSVKLTAMSLILYQFSNCCKKSCMLLYSFRAHPSTASVPTSYYSMWHYNCQCPLKG